MTLYQNETDSEPMCQDWHSSGKPSKKMYSLRIFRKNYKFLSLQIMANRSGWISIIKTMKINFQNALKILKHCSHIIISDQKKNYKFLS